MYRLQLWRKKIEAVERQIGSETNPTEKKQLRKEKDQLRKEKEQLRKEKEQLRKKEEQLRKENLMFLRRGAVPTVLRPEKDAA